MKKVIASVVLLSSISLAGEYDFDFESIEVESYEYSGYLRSEYKYLDLAKGSDHDTFNEALLDFKYFKDIYTLNSSLSAILEDEKLNAYQLYLSMKPSENHTLDIGKKTLRWGKGYFFNPVAFLEHPKDPLEPEITKEGFVMANYRYNKSYEGDLKNMMVNLVYVPSTSEFNDSENLALKLYLLYLDTDIDLLYLYSDADADKIGFDFSKNLEPHFEIHGEFAKEIDGYHSYLLGLKYVTTDDITITSEYFYKSDIDKKMLMHKFSKKEPFEVVYATLYFKDMYNIQEDSHLDTLGFTYAFKNNVTIDTSYSHYMNGKVLITLSG